MPSYKDKLPIQTTINFDTIPTIGSTNAVTSGGIYNSLILKQDVLTNPVTGTGTAGQVSYFSGTSAVTGSANLFWDAANGRLGIGTNAPSGRLHLVSTTVNDALLIITPNNNSGQYPLFLGGATLTAESYVRANANILEFNRVGNPSTIRTVGGGTNNLVIQSADNLIFNSNGANERGRFTSSGNLHLGTFVSDSGQRLQVYGSTLLRGSGTTSSTTALLVQNSAATELLKVTDDGFVRLGSVGAGMYASTSGGVNMSGPNVAFQSLEINNPNYNFTFRNPNGPQLWTSGTAGIVSIGVGYAPTSGTGVFNQLNLAPTINQTGGANGITRGLYVNPVLTAAADWRSIEWSNNTGWGLYGAGTANNYLAGSLGIGATSLTDTTMLISKNMSTTLTNYTGIFNNGIIQTSVTNNAIYFRSQANSAINSSFNGIIHFYSTQATLGVGTIVTNQFGFYAESNLIGATNNYGFYGNIASGTGRWNLYMNGTAANYLAGNTSIGTSTESARLLVRGSGTTSSTTALLVQNSAASELLRIYDDGNVTIGSVTSSVAKLQVQGTGLFETSIRIGTSENRIYPTDNTGAFITAGQLMRLRFSGNTAIGYGLSISCFNGSTVNTSGENGTLLLSHGYAPTSGTGTFRMLQLEGTINQTGGANGITRGLYVNPTLTAAADWRSVEWSNNTGWGLYGAGTAPNYLGGALGIGGTVDTSTSYHLRVSRQFSGDPTGRGIVCDSQITTGPSTVTYFLSAAHTTATANVVNIRHFYAAQTTYTSGAVVTNQGGFWVSDALVGATNNFGFRGDIPSGTGRWNLYMNGTAANYLAGNTSIGTTTESARLLVRGSTTTSSTTALLVQNSTPSALLTVRDDGVFNFGSSATPTQIFPFSAAFNTPLVDQRNLQFFSNVTTQSAVAGAFYFTGLDFSQTANNQILVNIGKGFAPTSGTAIFSNIVSSPTINQTGGANGITRGLYVNPTLTAAADWRSVEWSNNTGWGLYGAGTANNYLAGSLGIGTTNITSRKISIGGTTSGSGFNYGITASPVIQSDGTNYIGFNSEPTTQATTFTLTTLRHFSAIQGTFGLNSTVTSQYGFWAHSTMIGATNNYGFYGDIASGTGRWNLYMNGTAANYLAGNTSIGTTTSSGRLTVQGSGTTSSTKALVVNNSTPTAIFEILDNGRINQTIPGATSNTIFGTNAGASALLSGSSNTFFGGSAGENTTTGSSNSFFGVFSGLSNTSGASNSSFGFSAGQTNVSGGGNSFFGFQAGRFISSGSSLTNASNSIFIGYDTRSNANSETNQIVIGYQAIGNGSNTATLGNTSITNTYLRGNINYTEGGNFVIGTTTGTKIGTATSQKIGFYNATPVVQRTTTSGASTLVGGGGTALTDTDTFDGYTLATVVKALRDLGLLA